MKNLNFPSNGVLRFGPKQFESVASADWVCNAVHGFLFIINIICKEGTEICGCMFAGYEGSICEFDRRLLSKFIYTYIYVNIYIYATPHRHPPTVFNLCFYIVFNFEKQLAVTLWTLHWIFEGGIVAARPVTFKAVNRLSTAFTARSWPSLVVA